MDDAALPYVATTAGLIAAGHSRRQVPRGREYVRLRRGVVAYAGADPTAADLRIAAVAAQLPEHALVGGWSAARLLEHVHARDDLTLFDGSARWEETSPRHRFEHGARVVVCAPRASRLRHRPDVRVFRSEVPGDERTRVLGVAVTSATRTAFDLARLLPTTTAVMALDRLAHLDLVDLAALAEVVHARTHARGRTAASAAVGLADGGAESPQETLLRLAWVRLGLPRPLANPVVTDPSGSFVARVDLFDPESGVVGEYDGAVHADARRRSRDAERQEALESLGLVVVRATSFDLDGRGVSAGWEARLRSAYRRAHHRSGPRNWRVKLR